MSLLLDARALDARRAVAHGPLAGLATSLRAELEPVLEGAWSVPAEKALLSRTGGRCPRDGTFLAFDPYDARHRCPRCGEEFSGELHDRFRPYWYHLWLAERSVHAALLGVLLDDTRCIATASAILDAYAARYLDYPNRDNVLGPSRPFFSTYLESIWLLQVAVALDLLEGAGRGTEVGALGARVRESLIAPSAALVASYDEGVSNRQVWNDAAMIAAGSLLDDRAMVDRAIDGRSGLAALLERALLPDGSWYEGENYHLFAHRGLWYAVTMAERLGRAPRRDLVTRFEEGFAAPFRTLLPDLTYPSRRDSQYAVSVRQPRFAEACELGLARRDDERLLGMLARLYDPSVPVRDTGRRASTADVERNLPATGLRRDDLSWRSLLLARPTLPELHPAPLRSDLLPAQGFAILRRRDGEVYVALDYGHSGGGHGHPDRLNLLLSDGGVRWFDDPGTGSYVDESLHWYRSTLAHTAPLIDGHSQPRVDGELEAFDDQGRFGWIAARAELAPGCTVRRIVVVADGYLVDLVRWDAETEHEVALPFHGVRVVARDDDQPVLAPSPIDGGTDREDGFGFLRDTACARLPGGAPELTLVGRATDDAGARELRGWLAVADSTIWRAVAPGPPGRRDEPLVLVAGRARAGRLIGVWSWSDAVAAATVDGADIVVRLHDGATHLHRAGSRAWRIEIDAPVRTTIELAGRAARDRAPVASVVEEHAREATEPITLPARFELGAASYRGAEERWRDAGEPTSTIEIVQRGFLLELTVTVPRAERRFVAVDAENPFDNDPAAIHGDGVQLYVDADGARGGWLLVPVEGSREVGTRTAGDWPAELVLRAEWQPVDAGYRLAARIALAPSTRALALDVLVNLAGRGRARRRGQLVLSGGRGEFVYLRADRHDRDRLLPFVLAGP
jgi:hypothetical protein